MVCQGKIAWYKVFTLTAVESVERGIDDIKIPLRC